MGNNCSDLKLIVLSNFSEFGKMVNTHINTIRETNENYIIPITQTRFDNGEGKVRLDESVRGKDIYILADVTNWSETYKMNGIINHKSPDDHMQDIRRIIYAIRGQADSVSLITPYLYSGRQDDSNGRESLDCASVLQELMTFLGVKCVITYDAHNPKILNAVPLHSFDNLFPRVNIIDELLKNPEFDLSNVYVVSPDLGAMGRAREYADILKTNVGNFQKRRDLANTVDGVAPILEHKYTGDDVKGKHIVVVDDMISSGGSILEVGQELKKLGAEKIYFISTFTLFTKGVEKFDEAYEKGYFDKIYTSNLHYVPEEIKKRPWMQMADSSKHVAKVIHTLNRKEPISALLDGNDRIVSKISKYEEERYKDEAIVDRRVLTANGTNKNKIKRHIVRKKTEKKDI